MASEKIKIGATYASKHETWGPVRYSHVTDDGVHIFSATGSTSKAAAQFDEAGRCVSYHRGFRNNSRTGMIEALGYYRDSKPFLRRRVVVEGEEVFDGLPVWNKRLKTPQEMKDGAWRLRSIAHLGAGIDYEASLPESHISFLDTTGMTPEAR